MGIGIAFSVFLVILVVVTSNGEKRQEKLLKRASQLAYQKRDLSTIVSFLINPNLNKKLTEKDKNDIDSLANDILTQYSDDEQITEKLEIMCRRLYNLEKELEEDEDDFDDDDDDDDDL